jgi:hypothetical protein
MEVQGNKLTTIPKSFTVGGQDIVVKQVEMCDDSDCGNITLSEGIIHIGDKITRSIKQSETSKLNTFYHELTHAILRTMGEFELNNNEKFVCTFSGFLTEAIRSFKYE